MTLESQRKAHAARLQRLRREADRCPELIAHLKKQFGHQVAHVPGDPYSTAFRDGQRSVIAELERIMETEVTFDD